MADRKELSMDELEFVDGGAMSPEIRDWLINYSKTFAGEIGGRGLYTDAARIMKTMAFDTKEYSLAEFKEKFAELGYRLEDSASNITNMLKV